MKRVSPTLRPISRILSPNPAQEGEFVVDRFYRVGSASRDSLSNVNPSFPLDLVTPRARQTAQAAVIGSLQVSSGARGQRFVQTNGHIGEPISRYGPFVLNSFDEVRPGLNDFRSGKLIANSEAAK